MLMPLAPHLQPAPLPSASPTEMVAGSQSEVAPAEFEQLGRLTAACTALGLGLDETLLLRLLDYLRMLQRWNKVYNLTAMRNPEQMLSHHLIDCLAMLPPLRGWIHQRSRAVATPASQAKPHSKSPRLLDVGSGGGLPGVVLALTQPDWRLSCVDTVAKKASFIKQVAVELGLPNLLGLHARVENLAAPPAEQAGGTAGYDLITSRAFASLVDFTRLSAHLLAPDGIWLAMKGRTPDDEQAELPPTIEVFHVEQLQVPGVDAQRCLVWLRRRRV